MNDDIYSILHEIAKIHEIKIEEIPFSGGGGISGFYASYKNNDLIVIKKGDSLEEKTYTLAHELGHYFLHKKELTQKNQRKLYWIDNEYRNNKELEANRFAKRILAIIEREYNLEKSKKKLPIISKIGLFICFLWSISVSLYKSVLKLSGN